MTFGPMTEPITQSNSELMDRIILQAEEIGRLKERNAQLERENMSLRTISNRNIAPHDLEQAFEVPDSVQQV